MSHSHEPLEDSLLQLEEELRALVPADTSAGLRDRIFAALAEPMADVSAEPEVAPPGRGWFGWVPLAAAAAVALLAVVLSPAPKQPDSVVTTTPVATGSQDIATTPSPAASYAVPASWKPVSSDSRLEHVGYDGVRMEDSATYRQIRTRSMERRTFVDPANGTVVEVVFPRENVHLVPVVPE
ncbi:MAG: hypothetical protein ACKO2G_06115 [Verrucomicrobiales bacterium]